MSYTRVKICGITNLEDALTAIKAGADALGFVFYPPSPRAVTVKQAAEIISQLPAFVTTVALFVDATREEVEQVIQETQIDLLQFHGQETPEFCEGFSRPYIKAVAMQESVNLASLADDYKQAQALLLDTYKPGVPGGTGESFNWDLVPQNFIKPLVLAGGLTPENVAQAKESTQVYAVDVSGGVELTKGKKSSTKITEFIRAVRS